jgi:hypothetical protein
MNNSHPPGNARRQFVRSPLARTMFALSLVVVLMLTTSVLAAAPEYSPEYLQLTPTPTPPAAIDQPTPQTDREVLGFLNLPTMPLIGGLFLIGVLALSALLLMLVILLIVRNRLQQKRRGYTPPAATVPILKSPDGAIYFELKKLSRGGLVIGRDERNVDLKIPETVPHAETISKQHARIYRDPSSGLVIIEDLNSANGIFINGRRAPRKNLLKDGWNVALGQVMLTFQDGESDTGPLE